MIFLFLPYFLLLSYQISTRLPNTIQTHRFFFGVFTMSLVSTVLSTIVYYIHAITPFTSGLILVFITLALYYIPVQKNIPKKYLASRATSLTTLTKSSGVLAAVIPIVLLIQLIVSRSSDVLISPWHALPTWFFILFAIGISSTIVYILQSKSVRSSLILTSLYLFIIYSVAAILYIHGFGFDGFIHRATEEWIVQNGFINPKTPYYIGQYSFLAFLSLSSSIPVAWLDIFFVPVASALTLPIIISDSLKSYGIERHRGALLALVVPFVYFITLNLTTPHNLVILLFILTIFCLTAAYKQALPSWIPVLISGVALLTHPLLGIPLFIFTVGLSFAQSVQSKHLRSVLYPLVSLTLIVLPSMMFSVNNWRIGYDWPILSNPLQNIPGFFSLLEQPYWYADSAGLVLDLLYSYQRMIAPILIALALFALIQKKHHAFTLPAIIGCISFLFAAWLLESWLYFPGVAEAEQQHYPLRILWASVLFLLPLAAIGIQEIATFGKRTIQRYPTQVQHLFQGIALCGIVSALTVSFYFSYPQRNNKVFFPGFNVTDADVQTVQWIHTQHEQTNYIVLSNSLTSVAALSEYGFAQHFHTDQGEIFYYAIPTGGPLYAYYLEMIHKHQQRQTMLDAMDFAGVNTAYFTINSYWDEFEKIVEGAKQSANSFQIIDNGKAIIFRYDR